MSEVILTKNCKTSQKDPPPQKKVPTFSKGANDNTMTITWLQLWDRFLIFTIVLVLCSCTTNIWSKVNTTWQLCYCIFQKGPQEEYYNPAETLANGHFWGSVSREFPVERGSVVERPTFVEELSTCLFNSHCWSYLAGEGEETLITQLILRVLQQRIITSGRYHRHWNPIHFKVPNFVTRVP